MKFVGRKNELGAIQQAWEATKKGGIQLVVIAGEAGLGKTRTVQEFYGLLNKEEDPENYWPDSLPAQPDSLLINPNFSNHSLDNKIAPWLWWGIRWTQPDQRNSAEASRCAVDADYSKLEPHLDHLYEILEHNKIEKEKSKKTATTIFTTATDVALSVADSAFLGLPGAAMTIYGLLRDLKEIRQAQVKDKSLQEIQSQKIQSRLDLVSSLLMNITRPNTIYPQGAPLILVLDDIQFADIESLQFIQGLLRNLGKDAYSKENHLPSMLIIATTWQKEWSLSQEQPLSETASSAPKSFYEMLRALEAEANKAKNKEEQENSALNHFLLPKLQVLELRRLDSMQDALRSELPGLTDSQVELLLKRSGGLPRLLEQIILTLKIQPSLFIGRSIQAALTQSGEEEVREMSVEYHALLKKRLGEMQENEADILRLASYFGLSYSRPFAKALANQAMESLSSQLTDDDLQTILKRADNPLSIVQALSQTLDEFRLPAYQELLVHQLKKDSTLWQCLNEKIPNLLCEWVEDEKLEQMSPDERLVFLQFAQEELNVRLQSTLDKSIALALFKTLTAQIVELVATGRTAPMRVLFQQWFMQWKNAPESSLVISIDALSAVIDCAFKHSLYAEIEELCQDYLDRRPIHSPAELQFTEPSRHQLNCLWSLSYALESQNKDAMALEQAKRALQITRYLLETLGANKERQVNLSTSLNQVGNVLAKNDLTKQEALKLFMESINYRRRLLAEFGDSLGCLSALSGTLYQVGILLEQNDSSNSEATKYFDEALEMRVLLVTRFGYNKELLRDLSDSFLKDGIRKAQNNPKEIVAAMALCQESLSIRRRLLAEYGASEEDMRDLSVSLDKVGLVSALNHRTKKEAFKYSDESLSIRRRLLAEFGDNEQRLRDLSVSLYQVGIMLDQNESTKMDALKHFTESLNIRRHLLVEFGDSKQRLRDLSVSLYQVGILLEQNESTKMDALKHFTESLKIRRRLLTEFGDSARSLKDLLLSLFQVGILLEQKKSTESEALNIFEEIVRISRRLLAKFGSNEQHLNILSNSLAGAAHRLAQNESTKAEALKYSEEALSIRRRLVTEFGDSEQRLSNLSDSLYEVGILLEQNESTKLDALEHFTESLNFRRRLLADFGDSEQRLRDLSDSLHQVGLLLALNNSTTTEALKHFKEALEISRKLLTNFGDNGEHLRNVSICLHILVVFYLEFIDVEIIYKAEALTNAKIGLEYAMKLAEIAPNSDWEAIADWFQATINQLS